MRGESYFGQQYSLYGEVGVSPGWPVQVSALLPVTSGTASFHDPLLGERAGHASSTRLGDSRLAVQTQILRDAFQLAVAADVKIPLYSNGSLRAGHGVYGDYIPAPGDGQIDVGAWILGGDSIGDLLWYEVALGYRHRTEAFIGWDPDATLVDGVPFRGLFGGKLLEGRLLAMANLEGIKNLSTDRFTRENLSAGPSLLWTIASGFALEARFAVEILAKNQAQGFAFGFGVSRRSD